MCYLESWGEIWMWQNLKERKKKHKETLDLINKQNSVFFYGNKI